ncbi:Undecaprenyl-phosphate galactosephosphotransferase [Planococcus halocryophilus Or1]|uniref:UDP-phosphate galactose phosphotransferase n=1 Tax=Planococcus halocryophilus TaxID=1215089 RepID=A0A1C7DQQ7_9BACL|nr:sugar transferase [Planococcus halocryophilus]ANU13960.1 UDP-phosphate galactose phosphotransferase [Planococcus halocryophilus]EMF47439.1 Undecaprenyl-phosphate galactosephosphotransferase [Planococcus halocryophilus Or1]
MYKKFVKRFFDLILSIVALPFWLLILVVVGPILYFLDRGPIFYNASRLGKNGKVFKMYKFRSMKLNAPDLRNEDGSTFNSENDPRLTRIGKLIRKTSIDETPQLLNIIKGDMSIVGPRPDLPEAMNIYSKEEVRKLEVRPGITGFNQAFYRNSVNTTEKFKNDVYYVDNLRFGLDLKIVYYTAITVLMKRNIFVNSNKNKGSVE